MATYQVRSKIFSVKSRTTVSVEDLLVASIAQLVEHLICNQEVVGSIPIGGSEQEFAIGPLRTVLPFER